MDRTLKGGVSRECLIALDHIKAGANTTAKLSNAMSARPTVVGHIRKSLHQHGAIEYVANLHNNALVFKAVEGWEPPVTKQADVPSTFELEVAWPFPMKLPEGKLSEVNRGVW